MNKNELIEKPCTYDYDRSDHKSLDILVNNVLKPLSEKTYKKVSTPKLKYKQLCTLHCTKGSCTSKTCDHKPPARKSNRTVKSKSPCNCCKDPLIKGKHKKDVSKKNSKKKSTKKYPKSESSDELCVSNNLKTSASESFAKYGIQLPSFEDIVALQKYHKDYKAKIAHVNSVESHFDKLYDSSETNLLQVEEIIKMEGAVHVKSNETILGCKHLTTEEIERAFFKNKLYISSIFQGTRYSKRHECFQKAGVLSKLTHINLTYNTSMPAFTYEQKQHLATLLNRYFGDNSSQYYFKVLLPELCTKIFMDTHNMTQDEALEYLNIRPLDD